MFKYEIIIFWSKDDDAYIAEVPELPGCMADGESYIAALTSAQDVINDWIETANLLGREIPQPKGKLVYAQKGSSPKTGSPPRVPRPTQFTYSSFRPQVRSPYLRLFLFSLVQRLNLWIFRAQFGKCIKFVVYNEEKMLIMKIC